MVHSAWLDENFSSTVRQRRWVESKALSPANCTQREATYGGEVRPTPKAEGCRVLQEELIMRSDEQAEERDEKPSHRCQQSSEKKEHTWFKWLNIIFPLHDTKTFCIKLKLKKCYFWFMHELPWNVHFNQHGTDGKKSNQSHKGASTWRLRLASKAKVILDSILTREHPGEGEVSGYQSTGGWQPVQGTYLSATLWFLDQYPVLQICLSHHPSVW